MDTFIGIGSEHWLDTFDYVFEVLKSEQPEIILVEYGFKEYGIFSAEWARSKSRRIEQGKAEVKFDLTDERIPKIYLDDLCVFSEGVISKTPYEARAAISYALRNSVPAFFVNEPFLHGTNFSADVRERGIIGFQNVDRPSYRVVITDHHMQRSNIGMRTKERNFFIKAAAQMLDQLYNPKVLASVGGSLHYFLSERAAKSPFIKLEDYTLQFTLPAILDVKEKRIYSAEGRRLVEDWDRIQPDPVQS